MTAPRTGHSLTAERLRQLLDYDPATGIFVWKVTRGSGRRGSVAGYVKEYVEIRVDGVLHLAHRLAWLHVHGKWPADQVDHRNGIKTANWIDNLREATNAQNQENAKRRRTNTSGFTGVHWDKRERKWLARIRAGGKRIPIGHFANIEDAAAARAEAKKQLHKFQPTERAG